MQKGILITLTGKIVFVTGGTSKIGESIIMKLAKAGATGAFTYFNRKDKAKEIIKELRGINGNFQCYRLDISDANECRETFERFAYDFGGIDILVNNAGIWRNIKIDDERETGEDILLTNLTGTINVTRSAIPYFRRTGGAIVNIATSIYNVERPFNSFYAASKMGVIGFTRSLAKELASRGIRVNCVCPGWIVSKDEWQSMNLTGKLQGSRLTIPFGNPDDIANAVLFLVSELSSFITGEAIHVHGSTTTKYGIKFDKEPEGE